MRLFKRLFLQIGIPFMLIIAAVMAILQGLEAGLGLGVINGVLFGALAAFLFTRLQYHGVRRHAGVINDETLSTHQGREIAISLKPFKVFYWTVDALDHLRNCRIRLKDEEGGLIEAEMGMSWKTWGEKIRIRIMPVEGERSSVKIESRPLFKHSLVDYGKAHENIKRIVASIEERTRPDGKSG
jgi:hypothetical protein